jgi:hypothetical protein
MKKLSLSWPVRHPSRPALKVTANPTGYIAAIIRQKLGQNADVSKIETSHVHIFDVEGDEEIFIHSEVQVMCQKDGGGLEELLCVRVEEGKDVLACLAEEMEERNAEVKKAED